MAPEGSSVMLALLTTVAFIGLVYLVLGEGHNAIDYILGATVLIAAGFTVTVLISALGSALGSAVGWIKARMERIR